MRSTSGFSDALNPEHLNLEYVQTFENEIFKITVGFREGRPVKRVKEFKETGAPVLDREAKIKQYGLPVIWR